MRSVTSTSGEGSRQSLFSTSGEGSRQSLFFFPSSAGSRQTLLDMARPLGGARGAVLPPASEAGRSPVTFCKAGQRPVTSIVNDCLSASSESLASFFSAICSTSNLFWTFIDVSLGFPLTSHKEESDLTCPHDSLNIVPCCGQWLVWDCSSTWFKLFPPPLPRFGQSALK